MSRKEEEESILSTFNSFKSNIFSLLFWKFQKLTILYKILILKFRSIQLPKLIYNIIFHKND